MKSTNYEVIQISTKCLSQFGYFIKSGSECVVIDPLRDFSEIEDLLKKTGCTLKYIILTHFHADFVAGHFDLQKKTNAQILMGPLKSPLPKVTPNSQTRQMQDKEFVKLGEITLTFWHTPGHTPESSSILLSDSKEVKMVFTGDTLFLGDVGRPDLAASGEKGLSTQDLANMMFDSVQKLKKLPDSVVVFPGHGAGSACGKNISNANRCTIGVQRQNNYAMRIEDRETFVETLSANIPPPPEYFFYNVRLNKTENKASSCDLLQMGNKKLSVSEFHSLASSGEFTVLDCRTGEEFENSHVPGSFFSPFFGQFAIYAANIIAEPEKPILLVCSPGKGEDSILRLSRTGIDGISGYIDDFPQYIKEGFPVEFVTSISAEELFEEVSRNLTGMELIDVRGLGEFQNGHLSGSRLFSLDILKNNYYRLSEEKELMIYCGAGVRSVVAYSFLKGMGYKNMKNVIGGFNEIAKLGFKIVK